MNSKGFSIISLFLIATGLIVLSFAIFYFESKNVSTPKNNAQTNTSSTEEIIQNATSTTPTSTAKTTTKKTTPPAEKPLTYTEAINLYQNKRIQFSNNCQTTPQSINFLNNTKVMFDNRTNQSLNFYLDGKKYTLTALGFKIVTLYSAKLPHTVRVDCGNGVNNAQILLQ